MKCENVYWYQTAASFEVALPYCSNDHKMITTSITADKNWDYCYREYGIGKEAQIQLNSADDAHANR